MQYLIVSSICISVIYIAYRLVLWNETNFRQLRIYLLLSIFISGLIPLSNFTIDVGLYQSQAITSPNIGPVNSDVVLHNFVNEEVIVADQKSFIENINWVSLALNIYRIIAIILILRILIQVLVLFYKYFKSEKVKRGKHILIYNHGFKNTFSFFNWIFINDENSTEEDLQKIIAHENIHVTQYHSFDLLIVELLAAVMWFNPFVWMMKKSVQLVHEYLADEGVLKNGIDKFHYQELLINLVAEEKLISISSSFNQSLIKKRMIMMNKIKLNKGFSLKFLTLLPVVTILFFGVACVKGQNTDNKIVTAIAPTKMNVLYVGIENPVNIAVSGYESTEIEVEIADNEGIIYGENGNYNILPRRPGTVTVVVKAGGEIVQEALFRAKGIPRPIAMVNRQTGGLITKDDLLKQENVVIMMENFDFDISFEVVGFSVSTVNGEGFTLSANSDSGIISSNQKEIFKNVKARSKIIFDNISVKGPDGNVKKVSPMIFEVI
jgi:beta-lactamase regulating signal transducer with metallopeptidase domain